MARKGPAPQPTKVKKAKGNPGRRPLNENEPQPEITEKPPTAPKYLDKVGKKEWKRIVKDLHSLGLLTKIDITALGAYCQTYSTWVDAITNIQEHGVVTNSPNGYLMQSAYINIANKAQAEMRKWLVEFGMTPSSRSRISVPAPEKDNDPLAEFMGKKEIKRVK